MGGKNHRSFILGEVHCHGRRERPPTSVAPGESIVKAGGLVMLVRSDEDAGDIRVLGSVLLLVLLFLIAQRQ